jgi:glycerate kinase
MLSALGARLLDAAGRPLADGGGALGGLAVLDLAPLRARMGEVTVTVACDVDNLLTGPDGAAAIYGPQKGATGADVAALDAHLAHLADVVTAATGADVREEQGAGAAGGVGYAALAVLGARLRPGIDLVLDLVGFHEHLVGADLVITGEGSLDEQTLHGKAPAGVAAAAAARHIPVVAVCGRTTLEPQQVRAAGIHTAYPLTDLLPDVRRCITDAAPLLERLGERIATEHLTDIGC